MFDLKGKVAIITGGSSGIGASAVSMFHQLGAKVTIGDIQAEQGEALASELGDLVRFSRLDVTDPSAWERTVHETESAFGPVNILVNNAGHGGHRKSIQDLSLGSGLIDHNQKMTVAAIAMADMKVWAQRS